MVFSVCFFPADLFIMPFEKTLVLYKYYVKCFARFKTVNMTNIIVDSLKVVDITMSDWWLEQ